VCTYLEGDNVGMPACDFLQDFRFSQAPFHDSSGGHAGVERGRGEGVGHDVPLEGREGGRKGGKEGG